ncbi:MAG: DHH family phosphoesterase [candidate division WOR-3 bacterium]
MENWLTQKPDIIFTHETDLDGFVSGILLQELAQKIFGQKIEIVPHTIQSWRQYKPNEKIAWVSDLSPHQKNDILGWIFIDHHPIKYQPKNAILLQNSECCSAAIIYEICNRYGIKSAVYDKLVRLSNIVDLFLSEEPEFEEALDYSLLIKTYHFKNIYRLIDGRLEALIDHPLLTVMQQRRLIEDPIGLNWSKDHIQPITDKIAYTEIIVGNPNVIMHKLLEDPTLPFEVLVTIWTHSPGGLIASFRSKKGEAIKLAELLQGGGHPNAAAATLPASVRNIEEAIEYLKNIFKPQEHSAQPLPQSHEESLAQLFKEW